MTYRDINNQWDRDPERPRRDLPYQETDRISPHFGHMIQSLGDGAWTCLTCEPPDEGGEG